MKWCAIVSPDGERCVYPLDDLREHILKGKCWCHPFDDDGVTVHNSMDRREEFERGRKAS